MTDALHLPAALVVVGGVLQLQSCDLYRHGAAVVNNHHVCPKSWFEHSGMPVDTPMISLCPTCHANTHAAIDGMIKGQDISLLPPRTRRLADLAFRIAQTFHLRPDLTL